MQQHWTMVPLTFRIIIQYIILLPRMAVAESCLERLTVFTDSALIATTWTTKYLSALRASNHRLA